MRHYRICNQVDPNHSHQPRQPSNGAGRTKNRVGHYAAQDREEVGAAIPKRTSEVNQERFEKMLDFYDKYEWRQLRSDVPEPLEMIRKLEEKIARKKKGETTQEERTGAQRACCDFLNGLITSDYSQVRSTP